MSLYNPYLFVPLIAWFIAHSIKFLSNAFNGDLNFRYFYISGGMPSGHSATVLALSTTALVYAGWDSAIFGLVAVFSAIVIYDSFGVRRASGDQAVALAAILRSLSVREQTLSTIRLREVMGHKPIEVLAGAVLGVVVALAITLEQWVNDVTWLIEAPLPAERWLYFGVFGALLLGLLAIRVMLGRNYKRRARSAKRLKRIITWSFGTTILIGLFLSLMQFQAVPSGEWRLWPLLLLAGFLVIQLAAAISVYSKFPAQYAKEAAKLNELARHKRKRR